MTLGPMLKAILGQLEMLHHTEVVNLPLYGPEKFARGQRLRASFNGRFCSGRWWGVIQQEISS